MTVDGKIQGIVARVIMVVYGKVEGAVAHAVFEVDGSLVVSNRM